MRIRRKKKLLTPAQQAALAAYEPHLSAETRRELEGDIQGNNEKDAFPPFWGVQKEEAPSNDCWLEEEEVSLKPVPKSRWRKIMG